MTNFRMITGALSAMTLAVILAACDRPKEVAEQGPSTPERTAEQKPPQAEKAPEPQKMAQNSGNAGSGGGSSAAQDDPDTIPKIAQVPFSPGGVPPTTTESAFARKIMNDPDQIAAGKQLFSAMNCVGCHFHGGGGMGPALLEPTKRYGSSIENIAASIREGRPNGMPSFRGHVPEEQIWQLAAYVMSLSKTEPQDASTGASSGDPAPSGSN